jgi:hypothetical protein
MTDEQYVTSIQWLLIFGLTAFFVSGMVVSVL